MGHIPLLDSTGRRKQLTPVADIQTVLRIIVDVVVCMTGKLPQHTKHAIDEVIDRDGDSYQEIGHVNLVDALGRRH